MDKKTEVNLPVTNVTKNLKEQSKKKYQHQSKVLDISQLKIGSYSNYKVLCNALNEPVLAGNSKEIQLKKWSRYFNFVKNDGCKNFLVTEIYSEPIEEELNPSKYNEYIYNILLLMFYQETPKDKLNDRTESTALCFSKTTFMELFGMINPQFRTIYSKINEDNSYILKEFSREVKSSLSNILSSALSTLKKRKNLFYNYDIMVEDISINNNYGNHRIASVREIAQILAIEGEELEKLGCRDEHEAVVLNVYDKYRHNVSKRTKKEMGISRHYEVLTVNLANSRIKANAERLLSSSIANDIDDILMALRKQLNDNIVDKIYSSNEYQSQKYLNGGKSLEERLEIEKEFQDICPHGFKNYHWEIANAYQTKRDGYTDNYVKKESSMTEKK